MGKWARGQKDAEGGGEACAADSGGEVERMTTQGEADTLQIPKSRPRAEEVIRIVELASSSCPRRQVPTLDRLMKDKQPLSVQDVSTRYQLHSKDFCNAADY